MPELPEVDTIARRLRTQFIGQTVRRLWCNWPRMIAPSPAVVRAAVKGKSVLDIGRRGKLMVWRLAPSGYLLIHLRMSGRPQVLSAADRPDRHVHFALCFESGIALHLHDARKFARVSFAADADDATRELGIEPLSPGFTVEWLRRALRTRSRQLKPALLDQHLIAGLGNIYADEALHRARLHPLRKTDSLRSADAARLHAGIQTSLREGIRNNGASIDGVYPGGNMQNEFLAYGRTGEPCRRCGAAIRRLVVGQRGTHVCPRCQRAPRHSS